MFACFAVAFERFRGRLRWAREQTQPLASLQPRDCQTREMMTFCLTRSVEKASFEDPPQLRWTLQCKRISCVEMIIPDEHINRAVVLIGARLRDDLNTSPAPARIFSRVRILVDPNLLNG